MNDRTLLDRRAAATLSAVHDWLERREERLAFDRQIRAGGVAPAYRLSSARAAAKRAEGRALAAVEKAAGAPQRRRAIEADARVIDVTVKRVRNSSALC